MYKFIVTVEKDFKQAEELLRKGVILPYKVAIKGAWVTLLGVLGDKLMQDYNPIHEENKVTYTRESEDKKELEKDKKNLEDFLFGDVDQIKENEKAKKILSNRIISSFYKKLQKFIKNQLEKRSILTLMNSCSLFIKWEITEDKNNS